MVSFDSINLNSGKVYLFPKMSISVNKSSRGLLLFIIIIINILSVLMHYYAIRGVIGSTS